MSENESGDPVLLAAFDMIRRTGARSVQLRCCEEEEPTVWMAVVEHRIKDGAPVRDGGSPHFEAAAAMAPRQAVLRLLDQLVDGGVCQHCHRPTGVTDEFDGDMPMADMFCWYRYDPELSTFRRGCE